MCSHYYNVISLYVTNMYYIQFYLSMKYIFTGIHVCLKTQLQIIWFRIEDFLMHLSKCNYTVRAALLNKCSQPFFHSNICLNCQQNLSAWIHYAKMYRPGVQCVARINDHQRHHEQSSLNRSKLPILSASFAAPLEELLFYFLALSLLWLVLFYLFLSLYFFNCLHLSLTNSAFNYISPSHTMSYNNLMVKRSHFLFPLFLSPLFSLALSFFSFLSFSPCLSLLL
jgi:hypothetical protein